MALCTFTGGSPEKLNEPAYSKGAQDICFISLLNERRRRIENGAVS